MPAKNKAIEAIREILILTVSAAMFLSRLPLNSILVRLTTNIAPNDQQQTIGKSARYFGIAAFFVSLPSVAVFAIASALGLSPYISAILTLAALVLTTGALHEDALADVADGFGGGKDRDSKLAIMRDSQIGTYGACALILVLSLQIAIYAELIAIMPMAKFLAIFIAANVASTSVMIWPWANEPAARLDGGLSIKLGIPEKATAGAASLIGFFLATILLSTAVRPVAAFSSLVVCWICMLAFTHICHKQIGGHTGDSLGATKKLSEMGLLLALIIAT